jgi:hypothetical protein
MAATWSANGKKEGAVGHEQPIDRSQYPGVIHCCRAAWGFSWHWQPFCIAPTAPKGSPGSSPVACLPYPNRANKNPPVKGDFLWKEIC